MKLIIYTIFLFLATIDLRAQCDLNNTNTNPDPNYVQPNNGTFQTNTFKWWWYDNCNIGNEIGPINKPNIPPYVISPYWQTTTPYMNPIALGPKSDYKPQDGWELIKQDFGYYYNNPSPYCEGAWSGSTFGPNYDNFSIAYIMLYNKYQAKLRIFAILPNQGSTNADQTQIELSFVNPATNSTALFNNYNTVEQPLDQNTIMTKVDAITFQPDATSHWIYADFPVAYDPCTCFFQSGIKVDFIAISNATLSATGRALGTTIPLASIGGTSPNPVYGNFGENYLYSYYLGPNQNAINSLVQNYRDDNLLTSDLASQGMDTQPIAQVFNFYKDVFNGLGETDPLKWVSGEFGGISDLLDFFSSTPQNNNYPLVTSTQLVLQGNITTATDNGSIAIANPGSLNANNLSVTYQYSQMDPNNNPAYPMYNNPMGLFALLTSPHVNTGYWIDNVRRGRKATGWYNPDPWVSDEVDTIYQDTCDYYFRYEYQLSSAYPIKYSLNPLVDEKNTKISAALEIEGMPNTSSFTAESQYNLLYKDDGQTPDKTYIRYRTRFFPLECLSSVITQENFKMFSCDIGDEFSNLPRNRQVNIIFSVAYVFKPDAYGTIHTALQTFKYPLIQDFVCAFCYCNNSSINNINLMPSANNSNFSTLASMPNSLNLTTQTLPGAYTYAWNYIAIAGVLTPPNSSNYDIQAGKYITVSPNSTIAQTTTLSLSTYPTDFCSGTSPIPPTPYSQSDCQNAYHANQASNTGQKSGRSNTGSINNTQAYSDLNHNSRLPNVALQGTNSNNNSAITSLDSNTLSGFTVMPNPTTSFANFIPNGNITFPVTLSVKDVRGSILNTQQYNGDIRVDLSPYAPGLYIINIQTSGGIFTYKVTKY